MVAFVRTAAANSSGETMPIFQCFFYSSATIDYWENIDCDRDAIQRVLRDAVDESGWDMGEAWFAGRQVCSTARGPDSAAVVQPVRKVAGLRK
jgi:hypothetical protein